MSIDRATIIQGPCILTFQSEVIATVGDVTVTPNIDFLEIPSSVNGKLDDRYTQVAWEVSFAPLGLWNSGLLGVLFPYGDPTFGDSILGSGVDNDLTINGVDGKQVVVHNCAVTRMPSVNFSTKAVLYGDMTITGIGKNDTAWSDANKFFTESSVAFPGSVPDPADVLTDLYTYAWGAVAPWDDFGVEAGLQVDFALNIKQRTADSCGIVDLTIQGLTVEAKAKPMGPTDTQVRSALTLQGTGARPGGSLNANSDDLAITSSNVTATIYACAMASFPSVFSRENLRNGEVVWRATRGYNAVGPSLDPIFAFS